MRALLARENLVILWVYESAGCRIERRALRSSNVSNTMLKEMIIVANSRQLIPIRSFPGAN